MLDRIRRIVTGHDPEGRSTVALEGLAASRLGSNRGGVTEIWNTDQQSVDSRDAIDRAAPPFALLPARGGTKFLFFSVPPQQPGSDPEQEKAQAAAAFSAYRADGARPDVSRSPWMHKTGTVDYIVVLSGEVTMLLDREERDLKPFDVVVQRGTNHAWINRGKAPALLIAILIDADVHGG